MPHDQIVEALLGFADGARLLAVLVDAKCSAFDLRDADLDEKAQFRIDAAFLDIRLEPDQGLAALRRHGCVIETGRHSDVP